MALTIVHPSGHNRDQQDRRGAQASPLSTTQQNLYKTFGPAYRASLKPTSMRRVAGEYDMR